MDVQMWPRRAATVTAQSDRRADGDGITRVYENAAVSEMT